jgi:hypothetical protein
VSRDVGLSRMPRTNSERRNVRERRALINTIALCAIVVPPALALEIVAASGIIAAAFRFPTPFTGTTTGQWMFFASFVGLFCHYVHCHLIWWWIKRRTGVSGRGGFAVLIAYILVWVVGFVVAWR